jgi:hypothetical protein
VAEIVNLRRARKQKARADRERTASEHRAFYGRTKAERQLESAKSKQAASTLDRHLREPRGGD